MQIYLWCIRAGLVSAIGNWDVWDFILVAEKANLSRDGFQQCCTVHCCYIPLLVFDKADTILTHGWGSHPVPFLSWNMRALMGRNSLRPGGGASKSWGIGTSSLTAEVHLTSNVNHTECKTWAKMEVAFICHALSQNICPWTYFEEKVWMKLVHWLFMKCSLSANGKTPTGPLSLCITHTHTNTHTYALVAVTRWGVCVTDAHMSMCTSKSGYVWSCKKSV